MRVDVVRANHQRSLRRNFPIGLNQNDGFVADIQLGSMVSHSDAQGKSERLTEAFDRLPNVRVGQFWQHGTSWHGPIREHAWILRRAIFIHNLMSIRCTLRNLRR